MENELYMGGPQGTPAQTKFTKTQQKQNLVTTGGGLGEAHPGPPEEMVPTIFPMPTFLKDFLKEW